MKSNFRTLCRRALVGVLAVAGLLLACQARATRIVIVNMDGAGEGFNDPAPWAPTGGNPATTVGEARLIAFQFAADIWAGKLESSVDIMVDAQFNPLFCDATSAVLGSAGANTVHRDYASVAPYPAPVANTWYAQALANAMASVDLDPATADITATFNSSLDGPACLGATGWYYGLDGNPPAGDIDLVTVLLHEFGHGLGFQSFVNLGTGAKLDGRNDTYMLNLEQHGATPSGYPAMNNAQRVTASTSDPDLHWLGANVLAEGAAIPLMAGMDSGHVRMHGPNPAEPGSSVSHFSTALTPDEIMEPIYTSPTRNLCLTVQLMKDVGWRVFESGDLYLQDRPWDAGLEPNPDTGHMYKSQDIWVRNAAGDTGTVHENPEYSAITPVYVHVRVRNRGCEPASGELKVYWAKASTGLNWPTHWVSYVDAFPGCAATLYGDQIPTAGPLLITDLPAGGELIFEIPWSPPNPADYACFGDQAHFCLLARIETSAVAPFGMTFAEGASIGTNTRNNNNIAWKNVSVVDNVPGFQYGEGYGYVIMRNTDSKRAMLARLMFGNEQRQDFGPFGRITLDLDPELYKKWIEGGARSVGVERMGDTTLGLFGTKPSLSNILLGPGEAHLLRFGFSLWKPPLSNHVATYEFDVTQYGRTEGGREELVGGETFSIDLHKIILIPRGAVWTYLDDGSNQGTAWRKPGFDDLKWRRGPAQLGFGDGDEATVLDRGSREQPLITAYFRKSFQISNPSDIDSLTVRLKRDDGAVGYLNGVEIFRENMNARATSFDTLATFAAEDDGNVWHDFQVDPRLLVEGSNLLAVEVHQVSPASSDLSFDLQLVANGPPAPPVVRITDPVDGQSLLQGGLRLGAAAADSDGTVTRVDFYQGDDWIGADTTRPYTLDLPALDPRGYCFTARATDNFGNVGVSEPVAVIVSRACGPLVIERVNGVLRISWPSQCILQEATRLAPSGWVDVPNRPTSPYFTPATQPKKFYRLRP